MSDLSTLRMPEHRAESYPCRSGRVSGYAHQNPDGTLHCNRCGWTTPEPIVTTYSPDTDKVYLTWDEYVAAETNGYVVVSTTSRPGTHPAVVGPWPTKHEARRAQARLRRRFKAEVGPLYTVKTYVRILHRENG